MIQKGKEEGREMWWEFEEREREEKWRGRRRIREIQQNNIYIELMEKVHIDLVGFLDCLALLKLVWKLEKWIEGINCNI